MTSYIMIIVIIIINMKFVRQSLRTSWPIKNASMLNIPLSRPSKVTLCSHADEHAL